MENICITILLNRHDKYYIFTIKVIKTKGSFLKDCCFLNWFCVKKTADKEVDWSGRCETPAGAAGQVRPHRRFSAEEAHCPPRGKRATWSGNQPHFSFGNSNKVYEKSQTKKDYGEIFRMYVSHIPHHTKQRQERKDHMGKWNEQGAPNNNLHPLTIQSSNLVNGAEVLPVTEEKLASGKKDQITKNQIKK
ncbi:hypothetical protein B1NLA3E_02000 [Bacillus sp. 1NLA3E]|nr:hypothetical protein B1NLA3E_02000 [Bacillus sp. 1NLA3E]